MPAGDLALLACCILVIAFLYSSVGHAGASGYIAVMSLLGVAPAEIRPVALVLNLLVASVAAWQFARAGHFSWRLFWPFAVLSIPAAFLGGRVEIPAPHLKVLLGLVLWYSAFRLLVRPPADEGATGPPRPVALAVGAGIGLLAGLTGTGGGIFLTPILLFRRWARAKQAAAVSAVFILVNSAAGLLGGASVRGGIPDFALSIAAAALAGGAAGAHLGSRRFDATTIKRCLAAVLLVAGAKLLAT